MPKAKPRGVSDFSLYAPATKPCSPAHIRDPGYGCGSQWPGPSRFSLTALSVFLSLQPCSSDSSVSEAGPRALAVAQPS